MRVATKKDMKDIRRHGQHESILLTKMDTILLMIQMVAKRQGRVNELYAVKPKVSLIKYICFWTDFSP